MSLLAASAQEGARLVALGHLDDTASAAARLSDPNDAEALHDFRVGMRRLRSCLRAYDDLLGESVGDKGQRRLSRLASRTNPGREAEVQLGWLEKLGPELPVRHRPGVRWLADDLTERRTRAYQDVDDLHARFCKLDARLRERLSTYTLTVEVGKKRREPSFAVVTAHAIGAQITTLSRDLARISGPDDDKVAHRARIHGKRLRYLLEPLRGEVDGAKRAVKPLRVLQDLLGDMHDLFDLSRSIGQALEDAAVDRARQLRDAAMEGDVASDLARALRADERPGLLGLLKRVQADRTALFEKLRTEWLGPGGQLEALSEEVGVIVDQLASAHQKDVEIERKYLLTALPPRCETLAAVRMDQGYLPGERLIERVRRKRTEHTETYVRTVKLGEGIERIEVEEACSKAVFEQLWALTKGRRVRKRRYTIADGELAWEIDAFDDRELFLAEIELPAVGTEVTIPEWLAPYVVREVTGEDTYVNSNLAC
jgi:CHAD domain-containing protein/CYTH domain-containing protein